MRLATIMRRTAAPVLNAAIAAIIQGQKFAGTIGCIHEGIKKGRQLAMLTLVAIVVGWWWWGSDREMVDKIAAA